jgi:crotonobetainyl-CoA:carnitine CoA-transferase CaiB-like acyl-CoA transferase
MSGLERQQDAALDGCTVVEIGLDEAGQYAGRILASLGARVVKIEPLLGEAQRLLAPFVRDSGGRSRSIPYEYLNAGKCSLAADLDDPFIYGLLAKLLVNGGLVLVAPRYVDEIPAALEVPVLVASTYGAGPKAGVPATTSTRFHAGPSSFLMPTDRPLAPSTLAPDCIAGVGIAVSALGMLAMRQYDSDLAGTVQPRSDHALQAHAVNLEKMFVGRVSLDGATLDRDSHRFPFGGAVPCADGYVSMLLNEEHQWHGLCRVLGRPEWIGDDRFRGGAGRSLMRDDISRALGAYCATRSVDDVLKETRAQGVPVGGVRSMTQVLGDEVMRARGFLRDAATPYGAAVAIGLPFGADALWQSSNSDYAPLIGQHSRELLVEMGRSAEEMLLLEELQLVRCGDAI